MNDDELRDQLERRTDAAPLSPVERIQIVETVHSRSSKRAARLSTWFSRLAIPMAASGAIIVFVLAVGFPRPPETASGSPTSVNSPYATSSPVESESASPSAQPQSGLAVLSANELAALVADPSAVGQVVVSDAAISFVPSPTQFDVPEASPQAMGTIGSIVVMGQSFPDTSWTDHAFQVLDGGRLLYMGAVNDSADNGLWTVPDAIAAAPQQADSLLYAVAGWLLVTPPVPCPAPPDMSGGQDYWCGGSWLVPDKPTTPTDGSIHLQYPDGIHVQYSAYSDFAGDPQTSGLNGGDPRLGIYLIRPAGCPPNVMGDCPVWEMVGRLAP